MAPLCGALSSDVRRHLYAPRHISHVAEISDPDGMKLYGISASGGAVDSAAFWPQLQAMKAAAHVPWAETPTFAIFHSGSELLYLVLCWWGNDNELFVRVSVREDTNWVTDPGRYSFCLWDMEVMWHERQSYIRWMYGDSPDLAAYRGDLVPPNNSLERSRDR